MPKSRFAAYVSWYSILFSFLNLPFYTYAEIIHHSQAKTIKVITQDKSLGLQLDYSSGIRIRQLAIRDRNLLSAKGVFSAIQTADSLWRSTDITQPIRVSTNLNEVKIEGITMGNTKEVWLLKVVDDKIFWTITRNYREKLKLNDMAMPAWHFAQLDTWKGGILDNGGVVWCKYLQSPQDTYGVHTGGVTFWHEDEEYALRIKTEVNEKQFIAAKYSHEKGGHFSSTHLVTDQELDQRYNLSRFVHGKADVFAAFEVNEGKSSVTYELTCVNYRDRYDRGHLPGIDAQAVRELLNTTGRYGVVDNRIVGANGWLTNWKCLHEPFFAQIGLGVNDPNYTENMTATLDQERDLAMHADGRVLSRWHDVPGDEMPGTYNIKTGYYEATWGYTIDSQTGYIINTAEHFQQTGDLEWLRSHQQSCEKALNWLIQRDSNENGLVEMMNNNVSEEKASDWLDIVWAGFENAFVNAQLYESLKLWADCEQVLGDCEKANHYRTVALRLKEAFNKTTDEGGFWSVRKNSMHTGETKMVQSGATILSPPSILPLLLSDFVMTKSASK